jgi:hypothetical protein
MIGAEIEGRRPELATQPIAAEAGATQQGNMELGAPPVAYHCVCEDRATPRYIGRVSALLGDGAGGKARNHSSPGRAGGIPRG